MTSSRISVALLVLGAAVIAAGCGGGTSGGDAPADEIKVVQITPDLVEFGRETYARNCAPCHGPEGRGDGPSAGHLDPPPRNHTDVEIMSKISDKQIADTIKMGGVISGFPNMPSNPALSYEQIEALVVFVRQLSDPDAPSVDLTGFTK